MKRPKPMRHKLFGNKKLTRSSFSRLHLIVFALVFAACGGYVLWRGFAETAIEPAETAHVWVDTTGGTCTSSVTRVTYSDTEACASVTAAYNVVPNGGKILVKAGTYTGIQTLRKRPGIIGILIAPSGGRVSFDNPFCLGRSNSSCGNITQSAPPDNITIDATAGSGTFVFRGSFVIHSVGSDCGNNITIRGGHAPSWYFGCASNLFVEQTLAGPYQSAESAYSLGFGGSGVGMPVNVTLRDNEIYHHTNECRGYPGQAADGVGPVDCPDMTLAAPAAAGATSVTVNENVNYWSSQGHLCTLTQHQTNDCRSKWEFLDLWSATGAANIGQEVQVYQVSGNEITFTPALSQSYPAGTRVWAASDDHVDGFDIRGVLGTLNIINNRMSNIGSQGIFLGDAPEGNYPSPCAAALGMPTYNAACFEDVNIVGNMIDTSRALGASPNNAVNIKVGPNDPLWAPGSHVYIAYNTTPMGLNSNIAGSTNHGAAGSADTQLYRGNFSQWNGNCVTPYTAYGISVSYDHNAFYHTDGGASCSVDEVHLTQSVSTYVNGSPTAFANDDDINDMIFDLRQNGNTPARDCGNPLDFPTTDLFGTIRPQGTAPDCGAHEFTVAGAPTPPPTPTPAPPPTNPPPTPTPIPTPTPSPTPTPPTTHLKRGDLNSDHQITVVDLSILLTRYGTANSTGDIDTNGRVDVVDLSILLSNYGK